MVIQLHVATELQVDYATDQPFQLPKANVKPSSAANQRRKREKHAAKTVDDARTDHASLDTSLYGGLQCCNPTLAVVLDKDNCLNIFYDTWYAGSENSIADVPCQITYMYQVLPDFEWRGEVITPPWPQGRFPQGVYGLKAIRDPIGGQIHLVYGFRISPQKWLCHMDLGARFPTWTSMNPVAPTNVDIWDIGCFDVGFDANNRLVVAATIFQTQNIYIPASNFLWYPTVTPAPAVTWIHLDDRETQMFMNYETIQYGSYASPYISADLAPHRGIMFHGLDYEHSSRDWLMRRVVDLDQKSGPNALAETVTTASHHPFFRRAWWWFLDDPSTAPLGWVLDASVQSAFFVCNNNSGTGATGENLRRIFKDVPSGLVPLQISGVVVAPDETDLFEGRNVLDVHSFALFQDPASNLFELWHTRSVPGGVLQVTDGVFDIPEENWTLSSIVTKNIYCVADGLTGFIAPPIYYSMLIGNEPACVVVNRNRFVDIYKRESESTNWVNGEVHGQLVGTVPTVTNPKIYYLDIQALDENRSPVPGISASIGADSPMIITCIGKDHYIDATHTFDFTFSSAGKIGISVPANDTLVPSSFWIWTEGMEADTKVDIQPSPNGLHDAIGNLGTEGHYLRELKTQDNQPLVPPDVKDEVVDAAQTALVHLSKMITGPAAPEPTADRLHVAATTSLTVARTRTSAMGLKGSHFGRLKPIPGFAFVIDFKPKPGCRLISLAEAAALKAAVSDGALHGFWDDIGDFFSDVANAVVDVVQIVVQAVDDAYIATVHFMEDELNKITDMVIEFASQAASLATTVFDWIETTFEKIYMWLAFLFDFKSFKATADAFMGLLNGATDEMTTWIDDVAKGATTAAFDWARANVDGFFDDLITAMGTKTVKEVSQPVTLLLKGDPRVMRVYGTEENPKVISLTDMMSILPSSASWLLEKIMGLLLGNEPDPLDEGVRVFEGAVDKIQAAVESAFTGPAFQSAMDALTEFMSSIVSADILNGQPVAAILKLVKAFIIIVIDLVQVVLDALMDVFRYAVQSINQMFNADVDNPAIQLIYEAITLGDTVTWAQLCTMAVAIPHTIIWKLITGHAPYGEDAQKTLDEHDDWHLACGILQILKPLWLGTKAIEEMFELTDKGLLPGTFALTDSPIDKFLRFVHSAYQTVVKVMNKLKPGTFAAAANVQLRSKLSDVHTNPEIFEICADVFVALQVFGSLIDVMGPKLLKMSDEKLVTFKKTMAYFDAVSGVIAVGFSVGAYANTDGPTKTQMDLLLANVFSALCSVMALPNLWYRDKRVKLAVWIIRTAFCWTSGGLFIAAYEDRPIKLLEHKEEDEDEDEDAGSKTIVSPTVEVT